MAHKEQWVFCGKVKGLHPDYFKDKKVLDIGSFDVNGNEEFLFKGCEYFEFLLDCLKLYFPLIQLISASNFPVNSLSSTEILDAVFEEFLRIKEPL